MRSFFVGAVTVWTLTIGLVATLALLVVSSLALGPFWPVGPLALYLALRGVYKALERATRPRPSDIRHYPAPEPYRGTSLD